MSLHDEGGAGLQSPPYPPVTATVQQLYRRLVELHSWVHGQVALTRPLLAELAVVEDARGRSKAAEAMRSSSGRMRPPGNLPAESVWLGVSVWDHYATLMYVRHLREGWDHVLRQHEDDWDGKAALRIRCELVTEAGHLLSEAFTSPEQRELRDQQARTYHARRAREFRKRLRDLVVPHELGDDADDEDVDAATAADSERDADARGEAVDDWFDDGTEEEEG